MEKQIELLLKTSLDARIEKLPSLLQTTKIGMKQVWRYDDEFTFLHGWTIGRLENTLFSDYQKITG